MFSLHPPLSGLPLAATLAIVVCELFAVLPRFRAKASACRAVVVVAVVVAAVLSFLSGYQASSELGSITPDVEKLLGSHHSLGRLYLIAAIALAVFHIVGNKARHGKALLSLLYYCLLLVVVFLTVRVGSLGGKLVFDHGVGVRGITSGAP
jgi:uncharacterized membrane protein